MWILTHAFFSLRLFSQWMQLLYFKLVWMIAQYQVCLSNIYFLIIDVNIDETAITKKYNLWDPAP